MSNLRQKLLLTLLQSICRIAFMFFKRICSHSLPIQHRQFSHLKKVSTWGVALDLDVLLQTYIPLSACFAFAKHLPSMNLKAVTIDIIEDSNCMKDAKVNCEIMNQILEAGGHVSIIIDNDIPPDFPYVVLDIIGFSQKKINDVSIFSNSSNHARDNLGVDAARRHFKIKHPNDLLFVHAEKRILDIDHHNRYSTLKLINDNLTQLKPFIQKHEYSSFVHYVAKQFNFFLDKDKGVKKDKLTFLENFSCNQKPIP